MNPAAAREEALRLHQAGRLREAEQMYRQLIERDPSDPESLHLLGVVAHQTGRHQEALDLIGRALGIESRPAPYHNNFGAALQALGRFVEAEAYFRRAIQLQPDYAHAHNNLGAALRALGRYAEACDSYRSAIRLQPGYAEAHSNLGNALAAQGLRETALASFDEALRLAPDYADARCNRAYLQLRYGNFAAGWPDYEWRWKKPGARPRELAQPRWDGAPLGGRPILLHAEQGAGDALQFVRYAAEAERRGGRVIVSCHRTLAGVVGSAPGVERVWSEPAGLPEFDVHAPLMSLPGILATTLQSIPAQVPYLFAAAAAIDRRRAAFAGGPAFRVGICWQGNPQHPFDRFRSIALAAFEPLARVPGVRLYGLQVGAGREQLAALAGRFPVTDLASGIEDFADTAALMCHLDLVVCCDSAVAHLAGGLARPVWLALPTAPDWRWMLGRSDSPWYPTMRLYRQARPGEWTEVFAAMAADLIAAAGAAAVNQGNPLA